MIDFPREAFEPDETWLAARIRAYSDRALTPIDASAIVHRVAAAPANARCGLGAAAMGRVSLYLVVVGALAIALMAGLLLSGATKRPSDRLVFIRGGSVYVAAADGTGLVEIANGGADSSGPGYTAVQWSPDGAHIAAVIVDSSPPAGESGDAATVQVLTPSGRIVGSFDLAQSGRVPVVVSWAPDAMRVAVLTRAVDASVQLVVIGLDGRPLEGLAAPTGFRGFIPAVAWSPDGRALALAGCVCTNVKSQDLWIIAADGSGSSQITLPSGGSVWDPVWSPDGLQIAFSRQGVTCATCPEELWVATPDDGSVRRLVGLEGVERSIAWSPDGRQLAVTSHLIGPRGRSSLIVLPLDGSAEPLELVSGETEDALGGDASGTQRVVSGEDFPFGAADLKWSSDGQRVIYLSATANEFPVGSIRAISAFGGTSTLLVPGVSAFDLRAGPVGE